MIYNSERSSPAAAFVDSATTRSTGAPGGTGAGQVASLQNRFRLLAHSQIAGVGTVQNDVRAAAPKVEYAPKIGDVLRNDVGARDDANGYAAAGHGRRDL